MSARQISKSGQAIRVGAWSLMLLASFAVIFPRGAETSEPQPDSDPIGDLCALSSPSIESQKQDEVAHYHHERREAIYGVHETGLPNLNPELFRYDQVSGLLTISGFREYQPRPGAPSLRIRNQCIVSFVVDEEEAHDLLAQLHLGTVTVRVGYLVAAHEDYEVDFCPEVDDEYRHLLVDLLYVQLVDQERRVDEGGHVIDTYHTGLGYQLALRHSAQLIDLARPTIPQVQVSDLQWRPADLRWGDPLQEEHGEQVLALEHRLQPWIEQSLYPCYVRALAKNASLQGAVVLEIPLGEDGADAGFLMDTMRTEGLRECIRHQLSSIDEQLGSAALEGVDALKATVLMRRR